MRCMVSGRATGVVLRSFQPINFLGMVNKKTGIIGDATHDLYGRQLDGSILVFPYGVGSSVGAYTIHSLHAGGVAPAAMICERADLTVATGCAVSGIPMAVATNAEMEMLRQGTYAHIDTGVGTIQMGQDQT